MLTTTKPNRCKHCRERMPAEFARHVLHDECIPAFLSALAAKKAAKEKREQRAKEKLERAETRRRREAVKSWAKHHADTQKVVNAFIRARDAGEPCISCGTPWQADFQAGHYRSVGANKNLALDPRNIHGQCVQCNLHKHSNAIDYRIGLVGRYGPEFVEALECDNAPRHHSIDDLKAIAAEYRAKTAQMKKERV